jgi:hypothetical protein
MDPETTTMDPTFMHTYIIHNLMNKEYDLTQLDNEFIIFCEMLLDIQIFAFNEMFEGNIGSGDVRYSDTNMTFKGNEQDLLHAANIAKIIHPILKEVEEEISRRDIDRDTLRKNALLAYANFQGIDMTNHPLV